MAGVPNHILVLYVPCCDTGEDLLHTVPRDEIWVEKPIVPWNLLLIFLDS